MAFWPYAFAAMEFIEALGYEWNNELGFDCHESYLVRCSVPEGMVGYLAWLAQHTRSVARLPEEFRYRDASRKAATAANLYLEVFDRTFS